MKILILLSLSLLANLSFASEPSILTCKHSDDRASIEFSARLFSNSKLYGMKDVHGDPKALRVVVNPKNSSGIYHSGTLLPNPTTVERGIYQGYIWYGADSYCYNGCLDLFFPQDFSEQQQFIAIVRGMENISNQIHSFNYPVLCKFL